MSARRTWRSVALAAIAVAALAVLASPAGAVAVPVRGSATGVRTVTNLGGVAFSPAESFTLAQGPLAGAVWTAEYTFVSPSNVTDTGSVTIVTPGGTLTGYVSAYSAACVQGCAPPVIGSIIRFEETMTVTGGTGRFARASGGSVTLAGDATLFAGEFSTVFQTSISARVTGSIVS